MELPKVRNKIVETVDEIKSHYCLKKIDTPIYHYTNIHALKSIIENGKLWASNNMFMNDKLEGIHLTDKISNIIDNHPEMKKIQEEGREFIHKLMGNIYDKVINDLRNEVHIICFTDKADSLMIWQNYANNDGYNIEFDFSDPLKFISKVKKGINIKSDMNIHINIILGKIIYDNSKKEDIISKYSDLCFAVLKDHFQNNTISIEQIGSDLPYILTSLGNFAFFSKDESFSDENEYRMIIGIETKGGKQVLNKFRIAHGILIPFIEIDLLSGDKKLPIKRIIVGPKTQEDAAVKGLKYLLDNNGYNNIEIVKSKIPLRY